MAYRQCFMLVTATILYSHCFTIELNNSKMLYKYSCGVDTDRLKKKVYTWILTGQERKKSTWGMQLKPANTFENVIELQTRELFSLSSKHGIHYYEQTHKRTLNRFHFRYVVCQRLGNEKFQFSIMPQDITWWLHQFNWYRIVIVAKVTIFSPKIHSSKLFWMARKPNQHTHFT